MAGQSAQVIDFEAYRKARSSAQPVPANTTATSGAMMPICFVWMPVWSMIPSVQNRF